MKKFFLLTHQKNKQLSKNRVKGKKRRCFKMINKIITVFIVLLLALGGAALAAQETEPISPDDPLYEAVRELEEAQFDISEDTIEKVALRNEFAARRLASLGKIVEEGKPEFVGQLLEEYSNQNRQLTETLDDVDGPDAEKMMQLVTEANKQRNEHLAQMSEDERLPEEARAGMQRALENQELAMQKLQEALEKAQDARQRAGEQANEAMNRGEASGNAAGEPSNEGEGNGNSGVDNAPAGPGNNRARP
jgi:hypothetical protein